MSGAMSRHRARSTVAPGTPIRIGFVLTELVGGGAERSMLSIIDALDRERFAPVLVLFVDRQDHAPPQGDLRSVHAAGSSR